MDLTAKALAGEGMTELMDDGGHGEAAVGNQNDFERHPARRIQQRDAVGKRLPLQCDQDSVDRKYNGRQNHEGRPPEE